jgi:hypothetical protein
MPEQPPAQDDAPAADDPKSPRAVRIRVGSHKHEARSFLLTLRGPDAERTNDVLTQHHFLNPYDAMSHGQLAVAAVLFWLLEAGALHPHPQAIASSAEELAVGGWQLTLQRWAAMHPGEARRATRPKLYVPDGAAPRREG